MSTVATSATEESVKPEPIPAPSRLSLEDFIARESEHKKIGGFWYEEEGTSVNISFVCLEKEPNNEWLRFDFETPVYRDIDKIYCSLQGELMVLSKPFLFTAYTPNPKTPDAPDGAFHISRAYSVECDKCEIDIGLMVTNLERFYCEECFDTLPDEETENSIVVLSDKLYTLRVETET